MVAPTFTACETGHDGRSRERAMRRPVGPRTDDARDTPELPFPDRAAAGQALARRLAEVVPPPDADRPRPVVLGIPRGGVPVAATVAEALGADLDVLVAHKVGAPGEPELAVGAVAADGSSLMEPWASEVGITDDAAFRRAADAELVRARARETKLRAGRPPVPLADRAVILIDDGMATGATMHVATLAARRAGAERTIVAVPVASAEAVETLRRVADAVVVVATPRWFRAVGEWYRRFEQIDDAEVERILAEAARRSAGPPIDPPGDAPAQIDP
jgi:putative phosphoribosyl transferase